MKNTNVPRLDGAASLSARFRAWACDVWGVIHNGVRPVEPTIEALIRHRRAGGLVILLTNAPRPAAAVRAQLDEIGVAHAAYDAIVSSGDVTRSLLAARPGQKLYHLGPDRDKPLLTGLDAPLVPVEKADYVLCSGFHDDENETPDDYRPILERMRACGLPMLCANPDIIAGRGGRQIYCGGALARVYEQLGGEVTYAGKPYAPIYDMTQRRFSELAGRPVGRAGMLAIGDGVATDMGGAIRADIAALFVASGIHADEAQEQEGVDGLFRDWPRRPLGWQHVLHW